MRQSVNRRHFLQGVVVAASVGALGRAAAQADASKPKLKAGIIGLGGRGGMIADMVASHGGYTIAAVADYFPEVSDAAGEHLNVPKSRRFSGLLGYQRLIDSGVDAVFLETPPYCFPDHVEAAVAAGVHVYMAKPLACDVAGVLRIEAAAAHAKEKGLVFLVDFQTRTDPYIIEGVKRVHEGEIGAIGLLASRYTDEAFPDPVLEDTIESRLQHLIWVNDNAIGGGYLVNAGIHAVDMALWLAQATPVSATGASRIVREEPHGDSHDVYSLTYEFESGLILNHWGEHLRNSFGFHCDCMAQCQFGHLEAPYVGNVSMPAIRGGWGGGAVEQLYPEGAKRNIAAFRTCVADGDTSNTTLAPSVSATLATLLGREAAARKARVTWAQMLEEKWAIPVDLSGLTA